MKDQTPYPYGKRPRLNEWARKNWNEFDRATIAWLVLIAFVFYLALTR